MSARFYRLAGRLCLLCIILVAPAMPDATAAEDPIKLRAMPEQIALQPGAARQEIVLIAQVTLPQGASLRDFSLATLASPELRTTIKAAPAAASDGDLAWTIEIVATERAPKESIVVFRLDYGFEPATGARRRGVTATSVKLSYTAQPLAASVTTTVQHGFETLRANTAEDAVLVITNAGLEEVALEQVERISPDFINVAAAVSLPVIVPGRNSVGVAIRLTPNKRIAQGTIPLLLRLTFSRASGLAQQRETVIVSDKVATAIPGLTEIKTVLQIPSLLLLPGLLIVLTWGLIWRFTTAPINGARPEFFLSARSPEFYLVSVTLSLIAAFLYPLMRGVSVDFLERVSVSDIAYIWFGSILIAPVLYLAGVLAVAAGQQWRESKAKEERSQQAAAEEAERRRKNPLPGDKAFSILEKLAIHGQPLRLPSYSFQGHRVFKLGFGEAAADHSWVAPAIGIRVRENTGDLKARIDTCIGQGKTASLLDLLGPNASGYDIDWQAAGTIRAPQQIPSVELNDVQGEQSLVRRL